MTMNRQWVTLLYFFASQSHQSHLTIPWPTGSEWHCFYFFANQSHQSYLIPWPTGSEWQLLVSSIGMSHLSMTNLACEWHYFIPLPPGSLINHVSSHDQQVVSDAALFLCQPVSINHVSSHLTNSQWAVTLLYFFASQLINFTSHPMTNREWVTPVLYFLASQSHQSCLIPWPTGSEWHCFISLPASLINWLIQLISWPTGSEWHCFISLPGSFINHAISSHDYWTASEWLCCLFSLPTTWP